MKHARVLHAINKQLPRTLVNHAEPIAEGHHRDAALRHEGKIVRHLNPRRPQQAPITDGDACGELLANPHANALPRHRAITKT